MSWATVEHITQQLLNSSLIVAGTTYFFTQRASIKQKSSEDFRNRYIKTGLEQPLEELEKNYQTAKANVDIVIGMFNNLEDYIFNHEGETAKEIIRDLRKEIIHTRTNINKRIYRDVFSAEKNNVPFSWINEAEVSINRFNSTFLRSTLGHNVDDWLNRKLSVKKPTQAEKDQVAKYLAARKKELKDEFQLSVYKHYRLIKSLSRIVLLLDKYEVSSVKAYEKVKNSEEFKNIVDEIVRKYKEKIV